MPKKTTPVPDVPKKTTPIPIRLDRATIKRIDAVANAMGTNRSAVIKFCVKAFLNHVEKSGGTVTLPANWTKILQQLEENSIPKLETVDPSDESSSKAPVAAEESDEPYSVKPSKKKAAKKKVTKKSAKKKAAKPKKPTKPKKPSKKAKKKRGKQE